MVLVTSIRKQTTSLVVRGIVGVIPVTAVGDGKELRLTVALIRYRSTT